MAEQAHAHAVRSSPRSPWWCRRLVFSSVALLTSAAGAAPEVPTHPPSAHQSVAQPNIERYLADLVLGIQKTEFDGGLDVVLNVDRSLPVVALAMTFRTGRAEGSSLPELCDYLRHHHQGDGSADYELLRARGAVAYQSAGWEHTTFTQVLPADELPFALWLEGQRLRELRAVPERARRFADESRRAFAALRPHANATLALEELAWTPRARSDAGVDLLNQHFFAPASGVLTLVGDFDSDEALRLITEHVSMPSPAASERQLPPPEQEHRTATSGAAASSSDLAPAPLASSGPELSIGFVVPGAGSLEHAAVMIALELLRPSEGQWHAGVLGTARAPNTRVTLHEARGQSLLSLQVGANSRRARLTPRALLDELSRLGSRPIPAPVLERARNAALSRWLTQLASMKERAELLGRYEVLHGDARLTARQPRALAAVTASDVQRVLQTFTPKRAFVLEAASRTKGGP
jgi:predicted Zn-dependent peptidase